MKKYFWEKGIQLSDGGRGKKKADPFDLCKRAAAMKQIKLTSSFGAWCNEQKKKTSHVIVS